MDRKLSKFQKLAQIKKKLIPGCLLQKSSTIRLSYHNMNAILVKGNKKMLDTSSAVLLGMIIRISVASNFDDVGFL